MSKLLIVESPAKAKTISQYLNNEYVVKASVGHIRDLPKSNKNAIDVKAGFIPHYEISPGKEHVAEELRHAANKADEVVLATDPDREGEAIAWHVAELLASSRSKNQASSTKLSRIVFNEITKEAVQAAIKNPRAIDEKLVKAQEARRVLDRLFGYDLSGLIWQKLRYGLSAGRVQSPALRILMEREKEIRAFSPEKFWVIEAVLATEKNEQIHFTCSVEPKTEKEAEQIVAVAKKSAWQVGSVEESQTKRSPRPPFTTSTLQQAASSRLGYAPSVTMRLAQKLYEAGHISYMRTDSTNLSDQALNEIGEVVKKKFGNDYAERQVYKTKSKTAQEAHEAIRPTHPSNTSAGANLQEKKLYELIWRRAVASQMKSATMMKTKVVAVAKDSSIPEFATIGSRIIFDGWLKADEAARGEDVELPKLAAKDPLGLLEIEATGKQTEPPNRYSEAGLIKELEKRGLGRPSTYATIIKTIQDRGYVIKEDRSLKPTDTGEVVNEFLVNHFADYISDQFTAEMEDGLDQIADGEREYTKTLKDFYTPFLKAIKSKKDLPKITNLGKALANFKCPVCGSLMIIKLGRSGRFLSCERFPDCTGALTIDGRVMEGPKETGELCPECGEGKLVEREGKFGRFVACSRYPKCKFVKKDEEQEKKNDTGVKCPVCNVGTMVEKRGRFGTFYGCSNYPVCKNIIKAKPTGKLCPECGSLMMEGTKTIPERCSNKVCPNHNPHKIGKNK